AGRGRTEEKIAALVTMVCEAAKDEETEDRVKAASSAVGKYKAGEPVSGLPALASILGAEAAGAINRWLGEGQSGGWTTARPEIVAALSRMTEHNALEDIPAIDFYTEEELLPALKARFTLIDRGSEILIAHRGRSGKCTIRDKGGAHDFLANIKVRIEVDGESKIVPAFNWFWQHKDRGVIHREVFKPKGDVGDREINLWTGYGV